MANGTTLQADISVSIGSTGRSKQGIAPPGWGRVLVPDGGGSGCLATGKSVGELMEGVNNFRWLQCRGATLLPSHPSAPFERPSFAVQQSPAAWVRHYGRVGPQKSGWNLWQGKVMIAVPRTQNQTFTGPPPQSGVDGGTLRCRACWLALCPEIDQPPSLKSLTPDTHARTYGVCSGRSIGRNQHTAVDTNIRP